MNRDFSYAEGLPSSRIVSTNRPPYIRFPSASDRGTTENTWRSSNLFISVRLDASNVPRAVYIAIARRNEPGACSRLVSIAISGMLSLVAGIARSTGRMKKGLITVIRNGCGLLPVRIV